MGYIVLSDFIEKQHKDTHYREGEEYPKAGFKVTAARVKFLQEEHPVYGVAFLIAADADRSGEQ